MLRHQKQGRNECLLAALAMLAGKTIDEGRDLIRAKFDSEWYPLDLMGYPLRGAVGTHVKYICEMWDLAPDRFLLYRLDLQTTSVSPGALQGLGTITIIWGKGEGSHIMAYENDLIFDSNADGPLSWQQWQATMLPQYGGRTITRIVTKPLA